MGPPGPHGGGAQARQAPQRALPARVPLQAVEAGTSAHREWCGRLVR